MSLQEWGALGELIGGVAVLFTLVYLAFQVRQSSKIIDDQRILSRAEQLGRTWELFSDHNREFEVVYPLFKKFDDGATLTDEELLKLDTVLVNFVNLLRRTKGQSEIGEYNSAWETWVHAFAPFFLKEGFGHFWWEKLKGNDDDSDFVAAMEKALTAEKHNSYSAHVSELRQMTGHSR